MPRKLSQNGGWRFDTSEQLNTILADKLSCSYCTKQIPLIITSSGIDRSNRRDCEGENGLETYHLMCYDLLLFGKITKVTERVLSQLKEKYES